MLLLSREDIKNVFSMKDAIEADKRAFALVTEGKCDTPLRTRIAAPAHNGCFLFMPSYAEEMGAAALKAVNIFPDNAGSGLPTCPAQVLLIDGKTGIITSVLDGTYITQLRTGASTGLAFDLLARKECKIGALIGTGGQAACQLEAMLAVRKLKEVRVCGRNFDRTVKFVKQMNEEYQAYGAKILAVKTSDEAIDDADLLVTVTSSTDPVFDGTKVKKGCTISCVGAYQHHMQELDPAVLPRAAKIYFDSKDAVLSEAGDILIPLEKGIITEDDFTGDIGAVAEGRLAGREDDDEIIVYETVGVGAQDLVTAKMVYEKAVLAGVGTQWG